MKYIGSKVLETDNLILRPTQEEDLKILWKILLDENVSKYYLTSKINKDWEEEKKWQYKKLSHALDKDIFQWSVVLKFENRCIGQVSCQKIEENNDNSVRDVGWFLDPRFQGHGYGSEAAKKMLDYMFNDVEIRKIETSAAMVNTPSWKIMEKLGFHRTGEIKKVKYNMLPEPVDCYCYEITREEYIKLKKILK